MIDGYFQKGFDQFFNFNLQKITHGVILVKILRGFNFEC